MGLFERLRDGSLGVEMILPRTIAPTMAEETSFQFVGPRPEVGWWVLHFPEVALDLSEGGWSTLQRDIERQTRALFEQMFRTREVTPNRGAIGPRTNDSAWSPVIELERSAIEGGSTLSVLHRMAYEPGWEVLMGHLLVPCAEGLIEARWVTTAEMTGVRESVWTAKHSEERSHHPGQKAFDDPALDADFPAHPLSLAREARRWLATEVRMRVLRPGWRDERAAIDLPSIGYAVVQPPRFAPPSIAVGPRGLPWASANRASFSGSDGIDWFFVHALPFSTRWKWGSVTRALSKEVEVLAREVFATAGVRNIHSSLLPALGVTEHPTVSVLVEGDGHRGPLRMVVHGTARDGRLLSLFLTTTRTLPADDIGAELAVSARTLRPLHP